MRAILQRVEKSSVRVAGETVGRIGRGLLVLIGVERGDEPRDAAALAAKLADLRVFEDAGGKMNLSAAEVGGEFLIVSQFTLAASLARGRRPSFDAAARPEQAEPLVEAVIADLCGRGLRVASGRFGAEMQVELINDGPVTFVLDVGDGRVRS
ncbi:MAG: D-aminoacyl-tRNA deacylase [Thermoanaerobaculia bacterium]